MKDTAGHDVAATLAERGKRYGEFHDHARIAQNIKRAMKEKTNWDSLSDDKKEALEMFAHKIARILNGDPEYADSWHDICGYSKLVEDRINSSEVMQSQQLESKLSAASRVDP